MHMSTMSKRIAVIGAGPSGMAVLSAFESARRKNDCNLPEIVCYEKQSELGGLWNYDWKTGIDEHGQPVHASMYRYLWSNAPKECLEFEDYSFEQHFGRSIPSYLPRPVIHDYLKGKAEHDNIRKYIKFNSPVVWVDKSKTSGKFEVTVKDEISDTNHQEEFDYLIVATGHFSTPHVPNFPGFEKFPGRILHSHDFRDAKEFVGKNVLIIGRSYSAEDIGVQCYKFGAKSVTFSYRSKQLGYTWPPELSEMPLLTNVDGNKQAQFLDGASKEVDVIILCTGYKHYFPFLPDSLQLKTPNLLYPYLYKGLFWVDDPKLIYIGMQNQFFSFPMFSAQACYIRDVILGRLPNDFATDKSKMVSDVQAWSSRQDALPANNILDLIGFQADYIRDLLATTGHPTSNVKDMVDIFKEWNIHKCPDGILTFRDHSYRSVVTGKQSPIYSHVWMKSFEDSKEDFLNNIGT